MPPKFGSEEEKTLSNIARDNDRAVRNLRREMAAFSATGHAEGVYDYAAKLSIALDRALDGFVAAWYTGLSKPLDKIEINIFVEMVNRATDFLKGVARDFPNLEPPIAPLAERAEENMQVLAIIMGKDDDEAKRSRIISLECQALARKTKGELTFQ